MCLHLHYTQNIAFERNGIIAGSEAWHKIVCFLIEKINVNSFYLSHKKHTVWPNSGVVVAIASEVFFSDVKKQKQLKTTDGH